MAVLEAFVYDPLLNWRLIDSMLFLYEYVVYNLSLLITTIYIVLGNLHSV